MKKIIISILLFLTTINLLAIDGTVIQTSFISSETGKEIPFSIYLPPLYNEGNSDFPLIFHLHGIGGTHNGNQISSIPESFEKALNKGLIERAIIVFPDGFKDAFWSDSKNSYKPAEYNLINELLPYIKRNYRVNEKCISIQGFSMGGFGASKIFSKYPDLFCSLISYDGAFLNVDGMIKFHNNLWMEIFDGDSIYFKANSPWEFFVMNSATLKSKPIRILKGSLGYNKDFNSHLSGLGYLHDYIETGCDHVLKCLLDSEGERSWISHQQGFNVSNSHKSVDRLPYTFLTPNPASGYIQINHFSEGIEFVEDVQVKIYNSIGQCVMTFETNEEPFSTRINISHLKAGMYFTKLTINQITHFQKVIIK